MGLVESDAIAAGSEPGTAVINMQDASNMGIRRVFNILDLQPPV